jgi:C-terminal processing protease CtpA/Prc
MRSILLAALAGALVFTGAALAGEGKCKYSTQECLDYMASRLKDSGWVGVELEGDDEKYGPMKVVKVVPDSPAEAAGIQPGDVLVAMNGVALQEGNQEKVQAVREELKPGSSVVWTMHRGDEKREVSITLGAMPADVLARYIGQHMLEHASAEVAAK